MALGIAELDRCHAACSLRQRYRALPADRCGASLTCTAPCSHRIVCDECEVLEDEIAGGRAVGIRTPGLIEGFEIQPACAKRQRCARTGTCETEQPHLPRGNGHNFADLE